MTLVAGVLLLALGLRWLPYPAVFRAEGVVFHGHDAFYHLRRIEHGIETGALPAFDRYLHSPDGASPIWPPALDAGFAALCRMLGLGPSAAEVLAAATPPLLGSLAVLLAFLVGQGVFGSGVGVAAALALALLGGAITQTRVGFFDHHALMGVLAGLFLLLGFRARGGGLVSACVQGMLLAVAILVWPGCLILLAIWNLFVVAEAWRADASRGAVLVGAGLAVHAVAAVLLYLGCHDSPWAQRGEYPLHVLSLLQPLCAGGLAAASRGLAALAGRWRPRGAAWLAALLASLAVFAAVGLLLVPGLQASLAEALRWLGKAEEFQASVAESRSLFQRGDSWLTGPGPRSLSLLVYVFPLLLLWHGWRARRPEAAARRLLVVAAAALGLVTLVQLRFMDLLAVPFAVLVAALLVDLLAAAPRLRLLVVGGWLAAFAPGLLLPFQHARRLAGGSPPAELALEEQVHLELYRTARWIQDNTPATAGWFDPGESPEYGILCPWDTGHVLQYVGHRPTVVDNFGDDLGGDHFADSQRFLAAEDEAEAAAILERYGARYVLTRPPLAGQTGRQLGVRLHAFNGGRIEDPVRQEWLPALSRLRLVYESGWLGEAVGPGVSSAALFKLWEFVPGALLEGITRPGEVVVARLRLRTNREQKFVYEARTRADERGHFELRMPYSTDADADQVSAVGPVRLLTAGRNLGLQVPRDAVREGWRVRVPPIPLGPAVEPER